MSLNAKTLPPETEKSTALIHVIDYTIGTDYLTCRLMTGELRQVDISDLHDYHGGDYVAMLDRLLDGGHDAFLDSCLLLSDYLSWLESQCEPEPQPSEAEIPAWAMLISLALVVVTLCIITLTTY
jgi:hypothetical protein